MEVDYRRPVPHVTFPQAESGPIEALDEELVDLEALGFEVCSVYYAKLLPGATYEAFARVSVARMLQTAQQLLPAGYRLLILDAYRPIAVQQALWDDYRKMVAAKNPGLREEEIDFKTSFFVSKPSYDENAPSLHNTGGAVDLTLRDAAGHICDMGTSFDDFHQTANTDYYEQPGRSETVRANRRILYNTMLAAGFTNLPSEWWHYDYGTKFWSYFTGRPALYKGILEKK